MGPLFNNPLIAYLAKILTIFKPLNLSIKRLLSSRRYFHRRKYLLLISFLLAVCMEISSASIYNIYWQLNSYSKVMAKEFVSWKSLTNFTLKYVVVAALATNPFNWIYPNTNCAIGLSTLRKHIYRKILKCLYYYITPLYIIYKGKWVYSTRLKLSL